MIAMSMLHMYIYIYMYNSIQVVFITYIHMLFDICFLQHYATICRSDPSHTYRYNMAHTCMTYDYSINHDKLRWISTTARDADQRLTKQEMFTMLRQ